MDSRVLTQEAGGATEKESVVFPNESRMERIVKQTNNAPTHFRMPNAATRTNQDGRLNISAG
jgi:hypothetical protein